MKGTLYGVGVGPGDPELLTLKAIHTIKKCNVIAIPNAGNQNHVAEKIISDYIEGKTILACLMPMTKNKEELKQKHTEVSEAICEYLEKGQDVCFVTLGDPSIYSTYAYIHKRVSEKGYVTKFVPGVPSFCAAAAALNRSLCETEQPLHIIPASYQGDALALEGSKVFMKAGRGIRDVIETIQERGGEGMMVEKCGMDGEIIYHSLADVKGEASYFSIVITD